MQREIRRERARLARYAGVAAALCLAAGAALAAHGTGQEAAASRLNLGRGGLAAKGYDVVAYFTEQKAVKGLTEYQADWQGAVWRFASAGNRQRFIEAPERYAPQYGGFCAYAVSRNYTADIDPEAWSIVDGRLFLNYSIRVRTMWLEERDANIVKGDANWPALARRR